VLLRCIDVISGEYSSSRSLVEQEDGWAGSGPCGLGEVRWVALHDLAHFLFLLFLVSCILYLIFFFFVCFCIYICFFFFKFFLPGRFMVSKTLKDSTLGFDYILPRAKSRPLSIQFFPRRLPNQRQVGH